MSTPLIEALRAILPEGVALAACDPRAEATGLWPAEASAMARAVPARQREFAAGRRAARAALAGIGMAPAAIPMGPDRAPVWPKGATGTLSHGAGTCLALAGRIVDWAGLGLDLEPAEPLPGNILHLICTPAERDTVTRDQTALLARQIFCAKEAAYKAQYTQSRTMLEFHDLEVTFEATDRFTARLQISCPPFVQGTHFAGRVVLADGIIAAVVALPRL